MVGSMSQDLRHFEVADPFGRTWNVEFRWQQNAISIRHADAIDCKYYISCGEEKRELVVALRHPDLLEVAARRGRPLTDPWVIRLANCHVRHMISTWEDMEKVLVTVPLAELERHSLAVAEEERLERERLLASR
jgi:lantibiotic modifying enzyme